MADDGGLRPLFGSRLRSGFHWQSIETGLIAAGVPDSNYCCRGAEGWVEFKQTEGWAVTLRPEQIGWLTRRARAGGRVFIAVRRWPDAGVRRAAADELWLLHGAFAPDLKTMGLQWCLTTGGQRSLVGYWSGGPARWDWDAVAAALTGRVRSQKKPVARATGSAAKDDI